MSDAFVKCIYVGTAAVCYAFGEDMAAVVILLTGILCCPLTWTEAQR